MADIAYASDEAFEIQHWLEHAETDAWMMTGPGFVEASEEFYQYILASIRRTMYQLQWLGQNLGDPEQAALESAAAGLEAVLDADGAGDRLLARNLASAAATEIIPAAKRELGIIE